MSRTQPRSRGSAAVAKRMWKESPIKSMVALFSAVALTVGMTPLFGALGQVNQAYADTAPDVVIAPLVDRSGSLELTARHFSDTWADLFIVSDVDTVTEAAEAGVPTPIEGVSVLVSEAKGVKCGRCWKHHPLVGRNPEHPDLCPRCAAVVEKLPRIAE